MKTLTALTLGLALELAIPATAQTPDPITSQMEADYDNGTGNIEVRFQPIENIPKEYQGLLNRMTVLMCGNPEKAWHRLHSIQENHNRPYAVLISKSGLRGGKPVLLSVPKVMFTEESWGALNKKGTSNFPEKWGMAIPGPPPIELPLECTLTSTDGRTIQGTIVNRTTNPDAITFLRKSDNRTTTIPLDKLAESDRQWVTQTQKLPKVLFLTAMNHWHAEKEARTFIDQGYSIVFIPRLGAEQSATIDFTEFDIIWAVFSRDRIIKETLRGFKGVVMVNGSEVGMTRRDLFSEKKEEYNPPRYPHIKPDENIVFYENNCNYSNRPDLLKPGLEEEAVTTAIGLTKKYPTRK